MASLPHSKGFMQSYAAHPQLAPSPQQRGQTALTAAATLSGRWALGNHVDSPQVTKPRSSSACKPILVAKGTPDKRQGHFLLYQLLGILCFVGVKVHWGNCNHSGQGTKLFLWIVKSLLWFEVCNFWLYLVAQHNEVIHLLTRSGTVPQTVEQSWHQHSSVCAYAGQMFVFYSLQ